MPPRAVTRRSASRQPAPESDLQGASSSPQPVLQKPNLPRLVGTPASRRQYTYGSGVEPPPARPGRGARVDQALDLGNAVGNVLDRQVREDEDTERRRMPPPPAPRPASVEKDELVEDGTQPAQSATEPRRSTRRRTPAAHEIDAYYDKNMYDTRTFSPMPRDQVAQEEMRDDRSFRTESDFFGDATIASSPRSTPAPKTKPTRVQSNLRNTRQPSPVEEEPEEDLAPPPINEPSPSPSPEPQVPDATSSQLSVSQLDLSEGFEEAAFGPNRNLNTPAPKGAHLRQPPRRAPSSSIAGTPSKRPDVVREEEVVDVQEASFPLRASGMPTRLQPTGLMSTPAKRRGAALEPPVRFATNHSEADDAIQREIEASEVESFDEQQPPAQQESVSPWRNQWLRMQHLSPFKPSMRSQYFGTQDSNQESTLEYSDEDLDPNHIPGNNEAINWWLLLHPSTYIDLFKRLFTEDWIDVFSEGDVDWRRLFAWSTMVALLVTIVAVLSKIDLGLELPEYSLPDMPSIDVAAPLHGVKHLAGKIGDYIPAIHIPSLSFGRSSDDDLLVFDDDMRYEVEAFLKKYENDFRVLKQTSKVYDGSLKKLEKVVPKIVHMELRDGKPVIAQDFWHAIRELMRSDGGFLTIDKKNDGYQLNSDKHWQAIASKLANDPALTSKLDFSAEGIEDRINTKMASFWDNWIKDNDHKISGQLGSALEKLKSASSERELNDVVKKLVKEHTPDPSTNRTLVTRDEFIRHVRGEFISHRAEIRAELDSLEPQIRSLIDESVKIAKDTTSRPTHPQGMTREDTTTLVNNLLRKALADINIEALARGKIHSHYEIDLKNQINYFGIGGGAIVDPKLSAKTYDPFKKGVHSAGNQADAYVKGIRAAKPLGPTAALTPWSEEGECWCAARQLNHRGNPHGAALSVLLGEQIIPQNVVIEHILPGATVDPTSRPREIEIHARIEDYEIRERVRDFSSTHFPSTTDDQWNAQPAHLGEQFVMIGRFVYEGAELTDGVYVHKLSSELLDLMAETDQVVVRAVSNHGAKNHTCFYRVRLYGRRVGVDE